MPQANRNKTEILSVSLPKSLKEEVIRFSKDRGIPVSQAAKDAFSSYVVKSELDRLQKIFGRAAKKLGIKTEEDVEKYFG